MIAPKDEIPEESTAAALFPNSTKVYVDGKIHPEVKVAMREVSLSPTNHPDGRTEENPAVRVYDTSGPWGDPNFDGNIEEGLPALRREWILSRGDVEEYEGRNVKPADNGYLSDEHADRYNENKAAKNKLKEYPGLKRKPLRVNTLE
jgi:phosphomethylpyrimidine synthase